MMLFYPCSVTSVKREEAQPTDRKLRRRSSSLADMTEPAPVTAVEQIKKREGERTSSSPDLNMVDLPSQEQKAVKLDSNNLTNQDDHKRQKVDQDQSAEVGEGDGKRGALESVSDSLNTDRLSVSTSASAVSGDDAETVIDEDEKGSPQRSRRSGGPLLSSDMEGEQDATTNVEGSVERDQLSASCSTLENEKQEGELESSSEPQRRQVMSVSFRQELLSVCQLKTDPKLDGEVAKLASPSLDVIQMLGRSLPHIVPHMMHNKREVCKETASLIMM